MNRQEAAQERKLRNYFPWFGGLCLLYGALFACCMYRNLFGCTFFIYTAATVILLSVFLKKLGIILKKAVLFCFGGVLLCGAATCITGSALLQWGNWCCALCLLLAAMLEQFRGLGGEPVFDGIRDGWHLFADTLRCTAMPVKELRRRFLVKREEREAREEAGELREDEWSRGKYIGAGLVAAAAAMCVLLPLLLSSDLVFRQLFVSCLLYTSQDFYTQLQQQIHIGDDGDAEALRDEAGDDLIFFRFIGNPGIYAGLRKHLLYGEPYSGAFFKKYLRIRSGLRKINGAAGGQRMAVRNNQYKLLLLYGHSRKVQPGRRLGTENQVEFSGSQTFQQILRHSGMKGKLRSLMRIFF